MSANPQKEVAPAEHQLCLKPGEKLANRFIVGSLIGQGGFGQIFIGNDSHKNNRTVAIKVEPKHNNSDPNANDPRRLVIENKVLIMLRGKRHIPVVYASGESLAGSPYIVMQFLGENLTTLRKQRLENKFSQGTAFRVAQQITLALENLHEVGFIHRDIKPSNCCIGKENRKRVYLVDFGMCRQWRLEDGNPRPPRDRAPFRGTIRYASHRALTQLECGPADDLIGWLYSVIELYQSQLPWAKVANPQDLIKMKAEMPLLQLCESMPRPFLDCFEHANSLDFNAMPDYRKVQRWLGDCLPYGAFLASGVYDWEI